MNGRGRMVTAGLLAGMVNGFLGSGGGIILVLLLAPAFAKEPKKAFTTAVCVMPVLSAVSLLLYRRSGVEAKQLLPLLAGGCLGGVISGLWLKKVSLGWLQKAFALLLLLAGIRGLMR